MKILHELEAVSCQNSLSLKSKTSLISFDSVTVSKSIVFKDVIHMYIEHISLW